MKIVGSFGVHSKESHLNLKGYEKISLKFLRSFLKNFFEDFKMTPTQK